MLKRVLIILIFSGTFSSFGQEKVAQFVNSLKTTRSNIKDVFPVVDQDNGDITLFLSDARNIYVYQLDSTFTVKRQMASESKRRKYNTILGVTVQNDVYRLFLTNDIRNRFIMMDVSLKDQSTVSKEFTLTHAFERLVQTLNLDNTFHLITTYNKEKGLYIYTFDDQGNTTKKQIDLSNISLLTNRGKKKGITDILNANPLVKKIDNRDPNSIDNAAAPVKMYPRENVFILTFDNHKEFTQILTVDLSTLKASYTTNAKPMIGAKDVNSNSYLIDDKLFTIAANKEWMQVDVYSYPEGNLIRDFIRITDDAPLEFSNSPMMQDKNFSDSYTEIASTKKFLKRVSQGAIGISVFKRNGNYEITLGASEEVLISGSGFLMTPGTGVPIAGSTGVSFYYNPSHYTYSEYAESRSTRLICIFDKRWRHIEGKVMENAFDKMQKTAPNLAKRSLTVFRYKDYYLQGHYNYSSKGYSLKKFTH